MTISLSLSLSLSLSFFLSFFPSFLLLYTSLSSGPFINDMVYHKLHVSVINDNMPSHHHKLPAKHANYIIQKVMACWPMLHMTSRSGSTRFSEEEKFSVLNRRNMYSLGLHSTCIDVAYWKIVLDLLFVKKYDIWKDGQYDMIMKTYTCNTMVQIGTTVIHNYYTITYRVYIHLDVLV